MDLKSELITLETGYDQKFRELKNNIFSLDIVVAERKAFLSTQKLMYKAKAKINDEKKEVNFYEILTDSSSGFSSGGGDMDVSPGFGFSSEKSVYKTGSNKKGI